MTINDVGAKEKFWRPLSGKKNSKKILERSSPGNSGRPFSRKKNIRKAFTRKKQNSFQNFPSPLPKLLMVDPLYYKGPPLLRQMFPKYSQLFNNPQNRFVRDFTVCTKLVDYLECHYGLLGEVWTLTLLDRMVGT